MHSKLSDSFLATLWLRIPPPLNPQQPDSPAETLHWDHVAVFYPAGVARQSVPPSVALLAELCETAPLPAAWPVTPRFSPGRSNRGFTIPLDEGYSVYGTGEVVGPLERTGTETVLWNTDNGGYRKRRGRSLYQSHPWLLVVRPDGSTFGVLIDTTYRTTISVDRMITVKTDAPAYRVLVIEQPSPQAALMALADLTGTMELPPLWALGYQQCRWSYNPDSRVREIADGFRQRQIPCDVLWMDIDYMDGFRVFTFDPDQFPDPKGLNDYLHAHGFKGVWMIDPGVKVDPNYALYQAGENKGYWVTRQSGREYHGRVWPGRCVFPDFTQPQVAEWWAALYADYMDKGIDGVWNDMNEPAVFASLDWTMPKKNRHAGGLPLPAGGTLLPGPHAQYHNIYGLLMVKASRDGMLAAQPHKRPFLLTRSNYLGGQRYAATWTGDNDSTREHMLMSIPMSLSLGLSGQPFSGPDIGGFRKNATPELYGQWIAMGALFPFCRSHTSQGTDDHEPWSFGIEVEEAARLALQRRYRLLPYLYSCFREAATNGLPVMRPLFFADPADAALRSEDQAFLLGNDLLVIPKWAVDPALPRGYSRLISLVGEASATDHFQCDLRIRDGAIIPLTKVIQSTVEYDHDDVTLLVSLDDAGEAAGWLYEDNHDGFGYRTGDYRLTRYVARQVDGQLKVHAAEVLGDKPPRRHPPPIQLVPE